MTVSDNNEAKTSQGDGPRMSESSLSSALSEIFINNVGSTEVQFNKQGGEQNVLLSM
jgi:hypothetical protein